MNFYAEVLPKTMGRVMYRINGEIKKYAPSWVNFVQSPEKADVQILDVIGPGSFEFLYKDKYILMEHCLITANMPSAEYLQERLSKAILVAGYLDMLGYLEFNNFNYFRTPWGADPKTFFPLDLKKKYSLFSTGHVAQTECIDAGYEAVKRCGTEMVHVGHDFNFGKGFLHFEDIDDSRMNSLYNQCYYVMGMRKIEGFELPIIEGLLTGTRGICLDYPVYHYWYGDLVKYVKDGEVDEVATQLVDILNSNYKPVTKDEINYVKEKFSWKVIMNTFWKKVEEAL
jgi:glycosyltransferase involved in cell wall biosynthesis